MSQRAEEFTEEEVSAAKSLWENKCATFLSTLIDQQEYNRWIKPIEARGYRDHQLTLRVPSQEFFLHLCEYYQHQFNVMQSVYMTESDASLIIEYKTSQPDPAPATSSKDEGMAPGRSAENYVSILNERFNFDTFLESECNRFARYIAEAVADKPGQAPHTVLFIHGPSGVGKTHLSQAIGTRVRQLHPEKRVCYVSCAKFEAQFVYDSKEQRNKYSFFEFYQQMDVLIIDDIQSLIGKTKTQQAFFDIFNHLYLLNKQIVLTCDVPPVAFHDIEERILTRIQGSMIVPLERPDLELRRKILKQRVAEAGVELGEEIVEYIAENMKNNVRELEGTMHTLLTYAKIRKTPIDLNIASRIMGQSISMIQPEVTMEQIVREVANEYGIEPEDLRSASRTAKIALPRQIVMYLTNKHTEQTLVAIAKKLKRKNHTTVMHGIKTISNRIEIDKKFKESIEALEQKLLSEAS